MGGEAMHVIAAGRFDVERMEAYVVGQGGRCVRGLCTMEATSAGKYVSWQKLGRGVMGMTVGRDVLGAAVLGGRHEVAEVPEGAIWLMAPGAMLKAGEGLPAGMSAMMGAMEGAEKAVFRVERAGAGFAVRLEARCGTAERAGLVVGRLKEKTEMLKKLLEREGKGAEKGELSGVLVGGRFWAEGARARGEWALGAEFVERLGR